MVASLAALFLNQGSMPQFVPIGQHEFEQTPLALSALNHARSFDTSRAGTVVRAIQLHKRIFGDIERLATTGRRPSLPVSNLRGHFFTGK